VLDDMIFVRSSRNTVCGGQIGINVAFDPTVLADMPVKAP
jgi:hypothetical protein